MARKLHVMTWAEVHEEMSIAGDRDKITQLGKEIEEMVSSRVDYKNIPELENTQFMLKRLIAELRRTVKKERERQHG